MTTRETEPGRTTETDNLTAGRGPEVTAGRGPEGSDVPKPSVTDEEIDAYLMRPLSDPSDEPIDPRLVVGAGPPPPLRPPPLPDYGPKRLYRDPNGRIAGVASGLAHYFNVDVAIVRLLFLIILVTTLSLPAYIIAWIAIPKAPSWPPPGPPQGARISRLDRKSVRVIAMILVAMMVIGSAPGGAGSLLLPIILIGAGAFLLNQSAESPSDIHAAAGASHPITQASASRGATVQDSIVGGATPVTPLAAATPTWAYETTVPAPPPGVKPRRRWRWLAALFVLPLMAVLVGILSQLWTLSLVASSGVGESDYAPTSVEDIRSDYSLGVGQLVLDLSGVDFEGETVTTNVKLGIGEMSVLVPDGVAVDFDGHQGVGEASYFGRTADGIGMDISWNGDGDGSSGTLILETRQSIGEMTVDYS